MPSVYKPYTNLYSDEEIMENRKEWANALTSGKYEQGIGYLNRGDKFCCLGVACEVLGLEGKSNTYSNEVRYNGAGQYPPGSVLAAMGLDPHHNSGLLADGDELAVLNDRDGFDFTQIAERILSETFIFRLNP